MSRNQQPVHLLELAGASRVYPGGATALFPADLALDPGDFVAVVGRSGSGKSTLLNLVAGLDRPTQGEVRFRGEATGGWSERRLAAWRGAAVGVVFQFFELLPTLTVLENVLLPLDFAGRLGEPGAWERARGLLERLGIADQARKLPAALSGGQRQRAALARALVAEPALLVADEPTGNLDSRAAREVMELLAAQAGAGKAVLLVTHERELHPRVDRVLRLEDGRLAGAVAR